MNERSVPGHEARVQKMSTAITGSPHHLNCSREQEGIGKEGRTDSDAVHGNSCHIQTNPGSLGDTGGGEEKREERREALGA